MRVFPFKYWGSMVSSLISPYFVLYGVKKGDIMNAIIEAQRRCKEAFNILCGDVVYMI
jgi:hypothetical protein